jgi:two-component system, cell cycle response regulator
VNESTPTVLVVDDDSGIRRFIERLLPANEFLVLCAASGAEGLTLLSEIVPDLVVLDVVLPDVNGVTLCRAIRQDPRLGEVPILLLTGYNERGTRLGAIEAGADEFITKPFDTDEFVARVRTITRMNRYRRMSAERRKFEWVVQNSDSGYALVNGNDVITYANPRAERYLGGRDGHAIVGRPFREVVGARFRWEPTELAEVWGRGSAPEGSWFLIQSETSDAAAFWLEVTSTEVPSPDGAGRLVSLRDVTTSHVQNAGIHRFHLLLQHKLRTPLTALLGSLELLGESEDEMTEGAATLVTMASRGAERLASEVEDVLQYVAAPVLAEPGREVTVAQSCELLETLGREIGVARLDIACPPELAGQKLTVSTKALEIVFREILDNSMKFHPVHEPTVRVAIGLANDGGIHIALSDDGRTLTPFDIERAWHPYYQGGKYNTGQIPGMGLGLATVSTIVWDCGGECRLRNRNSGVGVVVEMTLPTAPCQPETGISLLPDGSESEEISDVR